MTKQCIQCHRPLKDLNSIFLGMGPICRRKPHFAYSVVADTIVIFELEKNQTPVPNRIEYVLKKIKKDIQEISGKRIFYKGGLGMVDGIELDKKGNFKTFYPISHLEIGKGILNSLGIDHAN